MTDSDRAFERGEKQGIDAIRAANMRDMAYALALEDEISESYVRDSTSPPSGSEDNENDNQDAI